VTVKIAMEEAFDAYVSSAPQVLVAPVDGTITRLVN
jgi:hypothetical protein